MHVHIRLIAKSFAISHYITLLPTFDHALQWFTSLLKEL